ncbi:MAG TPA: DNA N-6-adenine-methyltransferase [Candidatus Berkiella sp.]|nr:DNA N-6-adenine-methyltransferase [Candidatus Berkiella sp.]
MIPAKQSQLAYVGSINNHKITEGIDRSEWYTPEQYIRSATEVLEVIDLDPYSDSIANITVRAHRYLCKEINQTLPWPTAKTVWMNPPYGRGVIDHCVEKFCSEWVRQRFSAIVLTNNATETFWFQRLLHFSSAICLTDHRIAFVSVDGKKISGNTRGQTFFYFGNKTEQFIERFKIYGKLLRPCE